MSARKWYILAAAGVILIAVTLIDFYGNAPEPASTKLDAKTYAVYMGLNHTTQKKAPHAPGGPYYLRAAVSDPARERGLSDRRQLAHNEGMLFTYPTPGQLCFWMKDMYFAVDIIWLDSTKTIVHIEPDVSPASYPRQFCAEGQYVIELRAGQAAAGGIHIGQQVDF